MGVCHAVFGPQHRFLRRACFFSGFVEVLPNSSVDLNNNTTPLDSAEEDDIEKSLVATFGNETNATNLELTSAWWGVPHHPIRRAMVCHAVLGLITDFCAEHTFGMVVESIPAGNLIDVCV